MSRTENESFEEGSRKAAPQADQDRIPASAERTMEREEERGVPRADHNLEENTGSEAPNEKNRR